MIQQIVHEEKKVKKRGRNKRIRRRINKPLHTYHGDQQSFPKWTEKNEKIREENGDDSDDKNNETTGNENHYYDGEIRLRNNVRGKKIKATKQTKIHLNKRTKPRISKEEQKVEDTNLCHRNENQDEEVLFRNTMR